MQNSVNKYLLVGAVIFLAGSYCFFQGPSREPAGDLVASSDKNPARAPAEVSRDKTAPACTEYQFTRDISARLTHQNLVSEEFSGRLCVAQVEAQTFWIELNIESPAEVRSQPILQVSLNLQKQIEKIEVYGDAPNLQKDNEKELAIERIGEDLLQQFFFFQKNDAQGEFLAKITRTDDTHFEKNKLKYLADPYKSAQIENSRHRLTLDAQGNTLSVEGAESVSLGVQGDLISTTQSYKISKAEKPILEAFISLGAPAGGNLPNWHSLALKSEKFAHAQVKNLSLDGVPSFAELLQKIKNGIPAEAGAKLGLYRDLVKRLTVESGDATSVMDVLAQNKSDLVQNQFLIGVLASTPSLLAQQGLLSVYQDSTFAEGTQQMVMNAWIASDTPLSPATRDFLEQMASSSSSESDQSAALLALGAQVAKSGDPAEKSQIENLLVQQLASANQDSGREAALDALGNTGAPAIVPVVSPYLNNSSDAVRSHAYLALRLVPGTGAGNLIASGKNDPSYLVKQSVTLALSMRDSSVGP